MQQTLLLILFLLIGFVLLIKGADFFVDGSSSIATRFHIPSLIIGLTIVAMGTSLPELSVSVNASVNNNNSLAISNAIGSNIFNLLVVLGFSSIFKNLYVKCDVLKRDFPISVLCLLGLLIHGLTLGVLTRASGVIFLILFVVYLVSITRLALISRNNTEETRNETDTCDPIWKSIVYIIGGIIAIKFGGDFVVDNAALLAISFGMSETLVGLTIVSIGTSLPELVTSVVAAHKNEAEMAIGNVIGSNIFNVLLILGTAAAVSPIIVIPENIIDILFLIISSFIVYVFCRSKHSINKIEGLFMLALYALYMAYIIIR